MGDKILRAIRKRTIPMLFHFCWAENLFKKVTRGTRAVQEHFSGGFSLCVRRCQGNTPVRTFHCNVCCPENFSIHGIASTSCSPTPNNRTYLTCVSSSLRKWKAWPSPNTSNCPTRLSKMAGLRVLQHSTGHCRKNCSQEPSQSKYILHISSSE